MQRTDDNTTVNHSLIIQATGYYNETKIRLDIYRELGYPTLEAMTQKHLQHWKQKLHDLIFDSYTGGEI